MTDNIAIDSALSEIIQPTESVKCALQAHTTPNFNVTRTSWSNDLRRILTVVAHQDKLDGREEGSVFSFKVQHNGGLAIQNLFPISNGFSVSMAQVKHESNELHTTDQSLPGFSVTVNSGNTSETFYTFDTEKLRLFLRECKHLQDLSDSSSYLQATSSTTFAWLRHYKVHRDVLPTSLTSGPLDLREIQGPLHARLSNASAGSLGDDSEDVANIREEWVRARARAACTMDSAQSQKMKISIRIGTFNVNGKPPTQDLSTWVRDRTSVPGTIAPLNALSPLSLSDLTDHIMSSKVAKATLNRDEYPFPDTEDKSGSGTALSSTTTLIPDPITKRPASLLKPHVNSIETNPDLLVLGFQELDLSTEALLYSTSTAKEDAWCSAIFASLGEKGELYEKLASRQLVGMLLVVIVKKTLLACFEDIKSCSAGTGILGVMVGWFSTFSQPLHLALG
jgi:phosphatidylinositol-bisphosphatase